MGTPTLYSGCTRLSACLPWRYIPRTRQRASPQPQGTQEHRHSDGRATRRRAARSLTSAHSCAARATQYGDSTEYAYGKRERLRSMHLWRVDPSEYHTEGMYLQLTSAVARQLAPMRAELLRTEV